MFLKIIIVYYNLYLDGPKDKLFYIFSIKEKSKIKLNPKKFLEKIKLFKKKKFNSNKNAQKNALIKTI